MHPVAWKLRKLEGLAFFLILFGVVSSNAALPYVHTQATAPIRTNQATLNGMVVPNGESTVAWFEWGTRGNFDHSTTPTVAGSGSWTIRISGTISNLNSHTTYQCRLVASNAAGIKQGATKMFTTGSHAVVWGGYGATATVPVGAGDFVGLAVGHDHSLALRSDGTVAIKGENLLMSSITNMPAGLTNITAVAASGYFSLALNENGRVFAWGLHDIGQTNVPIGLSNVVAIDCGGSHSVALRSNGTVAAWGWNHFGQSTVPSGLSNIVAVACGQNFSMALRADGTVVQWGQDSFVPAGVSNVVDIAGNYENGIALCDDGTLLNWISAGLINPPPVSNVVAIAGGLRNLALLANGTVNAWGELANVPVQLSNAVAIDSEFLGASGALGDNVPPQAQNQTFEVIGSEDQTITLKASDLNNHPLAFVVTSLSATGALYQYVGGVRGAAITSPNTLVSDPGCRIIFAVPANSAGVPYATFGFVANDGFTNSAPAILTVNVRGGTAFTQAATDIRPARAILNGMAVPNSFESIAWFEWGERGSYSRSNSPTTLAAGNSVVRVSTAISNLIARTTYQCRLVVSNYSGLTYGFPQFFTTGDKVFAWQTPEMDAAVAVPPGLSNAVAVAAGYNHRVALWNDGTIRVWGNNDSGQTNVPPGLSNIVAIAAGGLHSLALRNDGTAVGWGYSHQGQANPPPGSNFIAVAGGLSHSLGLCADGTLRTWGDVAYGLSSIPPGLSNVVAIACGSRQNFAVTADGVLHAWGANFMGEIDVPLGLSHVVAAAGGYEHSLALRKDGTMVAWGNNNYLSTGGPTNVPLELTNVVSIAAAASYSLALRSDGSLAAWGHNTYYGSPAYIPIGASNTVAVSINHDSRLALGNVQPQAKSQATYGPANQDLIITLKATDLNSEGVTFRIQTLPARGSLYQYAAGARGVMIASPNTVVTDSNARVIFAPESDAFASPYATFTIVANDGTIDSTSATVTVNIQSSRAFTQTASNIRSTSATLNGVASPNSFISTAWFEWGERGAYGQMTSQQPVGTSTYLVRLSETITNLIEGRAYQYRLVVSNSFGISFGAMQWFTTGDQYVTWGYSGYGASALNPNASNLVAVASGGSHNLALRNDGTVLAWGAGGPGQSGSYVHYGQSTVPAGLSNVVAISGGSYHSAALRSDGTVAIWGGDPTFGSMSPPPGLSNVIAVAAGGYHTLALRSDGAVVAWGWGYYGQTNVPASLSNVVSIAAGYNHSLAIQADGTVAVWGGSYFSDTNLPASLDDVIAVSALQALRSDGTVVHWGPNVSPPPNLSNVVAIADEGAFLKADGTVVWAFQFSEQPPAGLTNMIAMATSGSLLLGNAQPQATEQVVFGAANQDLAIGLAGSDANGSALNFRITTLPAAGTLYQFTAGVRGPAITTTNTLVSDSSGRVIFVPLANEFASPYAVFSYVASDGRLDSSPATVTIHVQQARAFTQVATHLRATSAQLNGMAVPNSFDSWAWFEWGTRGLFNQTTQPLPLGDSFVVVRATATLSNLVNGGTYQCRLVVSNVNSLTHGATRLFTTGEHVRAWGNNKYGQSATPFDLTNVVAISGGNCHSLALRNDGMVVAWGAGTNSSGWPHYGQAVVPDGLSNIITVAAGGLFSLALQDNGTLAAWGYGLEGQAAAISELTNAISVAGGFEHALALRSDGTILAWGNNQDGQTNVPPGLSNVVAIAAGANHSFAILASGRVVAWGEDVDGQSSVPLDLQDVVGISGGTSHSLATLANGDTAGWGDVFDDHDGVVEIPIQVPTSITNSIAVASGDYHCLLLQSNGTIVVWGYDYYYLPGATNAPPNLSGVVAIAAGGYHNLALGGTIVPVAISQIMTGAANQDLTITLAAVNDLQLATTKTIRTLPALGTIYQFTNGSRGAKFVAPNTTVSDSQGRILFAPAANGFGSPYTTFTFSASDGLLDSLPATITIHILPPLRPAITAFTRNPTGSAQLTFTGHSNTTYCVWASSNLLNWEMIGTADEAQPGIFQFIDATATNWPHRFYKAGAP